MIVDQAEIDALLQEAAGLVAEANRESDESPGSTATAPTTPRLSELSHDPEVARILKLRVPIIVQLAQRTMPIAAVRDLSVGAIIEFEKSVDDPLDLLVNNRLIGSGTCVKVGEYFGLRVTQICDRAQRIRSMGK